MTTLPKMTRDEERKFLSLAQAGDSDATERMIAQWLPFVQKCVARWISTVPRADPDDLLAVGMAAIWKAITDFDLSAENQFGAFVGVYIGYDVKSEAVRALNRVRREGVSLHGDDECEGCARGDLAHIAMSLDMSPHEAAERKELTEIIDVVASENLTKRQLEIFRMYVNEGKSSLQVARDMGISKNRVGEVIRLARHRLRNSPRLRSLAS